MNAYATFMAKVPAEYVPRIEQAISDAVEVLGNPNAPKDAYEAVANELSDLQRRVGMDVAKAWRSEIISQLRARLYLQGVAEKTAKDMITMRVTQVLELTEKSRGLIHSQVLGKVHKYSKIRIAAITAGVVSAVGLIGFVVSSNINTGAGISAGIRQKQEEIRLWIGGRRAVPMSEEEFRILTIALSQTASIPVTPAMIAALPATVQPVAAHPVVVTVTQNEEQQTYQQPIGVVISAMPERAAERQAVERAASEAAGGNSGCRICGDRSITISMPSTGVSISIGGLP